MRNLLSWISVFFVSLFAQVVTFFLSGIGIGYGFMVLQMWKLQKFEMAREAFGAEGPLKDVVTGLHDKDWIGLRDALLACDFALAVTQVPILGWHFVFGFIVGGVLSILVINIGTIYHIHRLSKGGHAIAEQLGAFPFDSDVAPGNLKLLPEILAELCAEFHLPVPDLYVLSSEEGMNAFVVGRKKDQSVLVVTRGMRSMSKQQLRGIIAHELAHIVNGDMVHNVRVLAIELGVNGVRHTAEWMLRKGWNLLFGGSAHYRLALIGIQWGLFLLVTGIFLWPMGLISSIVGSAVMATTNRRRELKADRLAANVLGSWEAIGDALKRILGHDRHGRIYGHDGKKLGHLMFAQANGRSGGLLGTHPKLEKRIARADRDWDGIPIYEGLDEGEMATESIFDEEAILASLQQVEPKTVELFRDPGALMLTVPTLLLSDTLHQSITAELAGGKLAEPIATLSGLISDLDDKERFALIELTIHTVQSGNGDSIQPTLEQIRDLAPANAWSLQCWVSTYLSAISGQKSANVKYRDFGPCVREILEVVSIGASIGAGYAELRFQRVWGHTGLKIVSALCVDAYEFRDLEESVDVLRMVPRQNREDLVNGFVEGLGDRDGMDADEAAFLRYLANRLGVEAEERIEPANGLVVQRS